MKIGTSLGMVAAVLCVSLAAQQTPRPMVDCYDSLADAILAVKQTEEDFVRSMLSGHYEHARANMEAGEYALAAAEMSLFANEGDNAIGGVRKRLIEGGHHHNAAGEAKGIYEAGFVIVTRTAKEGALGAAAALRRAQTDDERDQAWKLFVGIAEPLARAR